MHLFNEVKFNYIILYNVDTYFVLGATGKLQATTGSTIDIALCPGEVLTIECSIIGGGVTVWQGTVFNTCDNQESFSLRHSQFQSNFEKYCTNIALFARVIGVVNNSYVSELNVTVNLEMNNTTIECVHSYNITEILVRTINIIVISDMSQNPHPKLIRVSSGELTFNWNPNNKYCNSYFIESHGCGICPNKTYHTHTTCKNVSSINNVCSFTVGTSTTNGTWTDQVNITLRGEI